MLRGNEHVIGVDVTIFAWYGPLPAAGPGNISHRAGKRRVALPARIGRTRFCCRNFAGHRLRSTRTIPARTAHQVDVDTIVMSRVVAGRQHGREVIAGRKMNVAQKALLFRSAMPPLLHGYPATIREREGRYVQSVAKRMFGNARATGADHASAGVR